MSWKINTPSSISLIGPSGAGKSTWLQTLLSRQKDVFEEPIDQIFYFYGIESKTSKFLRENYPDIILSLGMPDLSEPEKMFSPEKNELIIFDDLGNFTESDPHFTSMLIKGCHHLNVTLISLEHNIFSNSKEKRLQSNQYHQIVLFRSKRNVHQIGTLSRQCAVADPKFVQAVYRDITSRKPYSYLVIDLRPDSLDESRLITNVFNEDDEPTIVYI